MAAPCLLGNRFGRAKQGGPQAGVRVLNRVLSYGERLLRTATGRLPLVATWDMPARMAAGKIAPIGEDEIGERAIIPVRYSSPNLAPDPQASAANRGEAQKATRSPRSRLPSPPA